MKKIAIALSAFVAMSACTNEIEFKPPKTDTELIMNALLETGELQHVVYLGLSNLGKIEKILGGSVSCYVNGALVAEAEQGDPSEWPASNGRDHYDKAGDKNLSPFIFNASLSAGDIVRIEAKADNGRYSASSTVVIPEIVTIQKADTSRSREFDPNYFYRYRDYIDFTIQMQDSSKDEDFYSLNLICHYSWITYDDNGNQLKSSSGHYLMDLDASKDLILSQENLIAGQERAGLLEGITTPNVFGAFYDSAFNGEMVTLRPRVKKEQLYLYHVNRREEWSFIEINHSVEVKISHIQKDYYYYLKALNLYYSGLGDYSVVDIYIPDNIEGGIGFVGIANSESKMLLFDDEKYTKDDFEKL